MASPLSHDEAILNFSLTQRCLVTQKTTELIVAIRINKIPQIFHTFTYCITTDDRLLKHGPDCHSFKCINNQNFTSTGQKNTNCIAIELLFLYILFGLRWRFPLYPEILQFYTIILQRIRIIAVDAGCEPGVSVSEVWRANNEPPHLLN